MSATKILPFTQWARKRTEKFVSVEPLSGYSIIQPEDDGYVIYLAPNASDEALGRALWRTARSRYIFPPDPEFSEAERYLRCDHNWQKDFMTRYGYKNKREAYKKWIGAKWRGRKGRFDRAASARQAGIFFRPSAGKKRRDS